MEKTKIVNQWCYKCDCDIEVEEAPQVGSYITCQGCGNIHVVEDSGYDEEGYSFWYLVSV